VAQPEEAASGERSESPYPELRARSLPWDGLDYFQGGRRAFKYDLRQWWPYRWSIPVVPAAICIVLFVAAGLTVGWRFYQSYPVSTANPVLKGPSHATFNNDCFQCHTQRFQTLRRLEVADQACLGCHAPLPRQGFDLGTWLAAARKPLDGPPALVHHAQQIPSQIPGCAGCHREHRGEFTLTHVSDGYCVDCHGNLSRNDGKSPDSYAAITSYVAGHPAFRYPADQGRLRFNHELHAGLDLLRIDGKRRPIECKTCHERNPNGGAYMLPVRYDKNCRECHPLALPLVAQWPDPELRAVALAFRQKPFKHGLEPAATREEVRRAYASFLRDHPPAHWRPTP
jgi:hypothetical protein